MWTVLAASRTLVPKLQGELDVAGDSARFRRAGGQRTFSSSRSVKRCSSSTISCSQDVAGVSARLRRAWWAEDVFVFSVGEEVFFIDSLAVRRVVVPLRALHALRRVVVMTVLNICLIVVRIPSHVFVVSLLSCIII